MLNIIARHWVYEMALGAFFNALEANFPPPAPIPSFVGQYAFIESDEGYYIGEGEVIQQSGTLIVVDDEDALLNLDITDKSLKVTISDIDFTDDISDEDLIKMIKEYDR